MVKIILAGLVCLFFAIGGQAQTTEEAQADDSLPEVEEIFLLRDDGAGKAGEETENFSAADKILHFRIQLSSRKSATVKMILVAVNVAGLKPETKSLTVSYKTNGKQNIVNFRASPEDAWLAGKYRADVFIDGKISGKKEFEIQKNIKENSSEKSVSAPQPVEKNVRPPRKGKKKS